MTITKGQAIQAGLIHTIFHDSQGRKWRSNGRCKTWWQPERRAEFRLPIKRGVPFHGESSYITHTNRTEFHFADNCKCDLVRARRLNSGAA